MIVDASEMKDSAMFQGGCKRFVAMLVPAMLVVPLSAAADSWLPPREQVYVSDDGSWQLTVTPRPIRGALRYFKDKVDGRDNPGALAGARDHAVGQMLHGTADGWVVAWRVPLVNDVAPVSALVSSTGRVVTFDNWHSVGHGDEVVVIYDKAGEVVRSMGLTDFLPKVYVGALPHSVSSIQWGGDHRITDDGELVLEVVVPGTGTGIGFAGREYVEVRFRLDTGVQLPLTDTDWVQALAQAEAVATQQLRVAEQARARFVAPLLPPAAGSEVSDWHRYLIEAFFRMDPDWRDGYPSTKVIDSRSTEGYMKSLGFLHEKLSRRCGHDCVVMIASPSQDILVEGLREVRAEIPPGTLEGSRVYVVADAMHTEAARAALANTGATIIRVDPAHPIPQRKERLDRLLQHEAPDGMPE